MDTYKIPLMRGRHRCERWRPLPSEQLRCSKWLANLPQIAIEKLAPGQKRREIPDGRVPSLYLVLQPSGLKSWAYRYVLDGQKCKHTIGSYPRIGLKEAREAAWKAKDTVSLGRARPAGVRRASAAAAVPAAAAPDDLVEVVVDEFLLRYGPNLKASTLHDVSRILKKDVVSAWRGRRLSEIRKKDVTRLLDAVADRGAPVGANRVLAWLRKMCNWAISRGLMETNPCNRVETPAPETSRERTLSDAELTNVWRACDGTVHAAFIRLLILTGARRNEAAGMRREEINLEQGTWVIPASRTKNAHAHTIGLPDLARDILLELGGQGEYELSLSGNKPSAHSTR